MVRTTVSFSFHVAPTAPIMTFWSTSFLPSIDAVSLCLVVLFASSSIDVCDDGMKGRFELAAPRRVRGLSLDNLRLFPIVTSMLMFTDVLVWAYGLGTSMAC